MLLNMGIIFGTTLYMCVHMYDREYAIILLQTDEGKGTYSSENSEKEREDKKRTHRGSYAVQI